MNSRPWERFLSENDQAHLSASHPHVNVGWGERPAMLRSTEHAVENRSRPASQGTKGETRGAIQRYGERLNSRTE